MSWDGRQHKVPVVRYERVGMEGNQIVWRMTLPCGHAVLRTGGREARDGDYGACTINGIRYLCVARSVACDVCRADYERSIQ